MVTLILILQLLTPMGPIELISHVPMPSMEACEKATNEAEIAKLTGPVLEIIGGDAKCDGGKPA